MINLEVFGRSAAMAAVAESLEATEGVSRVRLVDADSRRPLRRVSRGPSQSGRPAAGGVAAGSGFRGDISLTRVEVVGLSAAQRPEVSLVWEDVLGMAWLNARPMARYLAFMVVAGVIGGYGVIERQRRS